MTSHPSNAKVIGDLRALDKDVFANASEFRRVEDRLELGGHELIGGVYLEDIFRLV